MADDHTQPDGQVGAADGAGPPGPRADAPASTAQLTRSAGRGALWRLGSGGGQTVVRLASSMVLARVLEPRDFGLVGMAILVVGFIRSTCGLGMGIGIIAKKDADQTDMSTAFWTNLAVQSWMFAVAFLVAPFAPIYFDTPLVTNVLRWSSVVFLLAGIGSIPRSLLTKRLQFGWLVVSEIVGTVVEIAVAITLSVWFQAGYWSLVAATLIGSAVSFAIVIVRAWWRPSLIFSRTSFRHLFRFGINGLGAQVLYYFHSNIDYLLIARMFGARVLGLYEYAYRLPHTLYWRIVQPMSGVVFPTLATIQDDDERLAAGMTKYVRYVSLVMLPLLGGLAAVADPAVRVLWGSKWLPVIVPLQILCLGAAIRSVTGPVGSLFLCKQRPDLPFKLAGMSVVAAFVLVPLLGLRWKLPGVAWGMTLSNLPNVVAVWVAMRMVGSGLRPLVRAVWPVAVSAGMCYVAAKAQVVCMTMVGQDPKVTLPAATVIGGLTYVATVKFVFPELLVDLMATTRAVLGRGKPGRAGGGS